MTSGEGLPSNLAEVSPEIGSVRNIMNFLRHPKQEQALSDTARRLNEVYLKPLVDVETRWNSMYDMLQRSLKLKPCISHLLRHGKDFSEFSVSETAWRRVEDVTSFLKRFNEATVLLSGSKYPTLSLVVPVYEDLIRHCEVSLLETSLAGLAERAREGLLRYRVDLYTPDTLLASFIDPRFKCRKIGNMVEDVLELARLEYESRRPLDVQIEEPVEDSLLTAIFPSKKAKSSSELDVFISLDVCDSSQCPIEWWVGHRAEFPVLPKLAFDVLTIPATSVPSEQCFSKAGDVVRKKLGRLQSSTIEMSVLLNAWLK
ncbi:putative AC transposase [Halotydeus destructor]|nr:putative AC transposase [Halotydeus destructor]